MSGTNRIALRTIGFIFVNLAVALGLIYWFRDHLKPQLVCAATALVLGGVFSFLVSAKPPIGTRQLHVGLSAIVFLFLAAAAVFNFLP
jgi:hypothetical protein